KRNRVDRVVQAGGRVADEADLTLPGVEQPRGFAAGRGDAGLEAFAEAGPAAAAWATLEKADLRLDRAGRRRGSDAHARGIEEHDAAKPGKVAPQALRLSR